MWTPKTKNIHSQVNYLHIHTIHYFLTPTKDRGNIQEGRREKKLEEEALGTNYTEHIGGR